MTYSTYGDFPYRIDSPAYDAAIDGDRDKAPRMAAAWAAMLDAVPSGRFIAHDDLIRVGEREGVAESTARRLIARAMERDLLRCRVVARRGFNVHWGYTTAVGGEKTAADTAMWHARRQKALTAAAERRERAARDASEAAASMEVD